MGLLVVFGVSIAWAPAYADRFDDVRRDVSKMRYDVAEAALVDIARNTEGDDKQEALFLLAGLKKSVSEAEIIYQEVIRIDDSNDWGVASQVELAKIQYAMGNYSQALDMLGESDACRKSDEACYFQGLSAVMAKRFDVAEESLSKVKSGKFRPWAYLSLAEVEMELDNADEACRKYRSMARSLISPTAMYRYGECLEKQGDSPAATEIFEEIVDNFENTPEALLANEKLNIIRRGSQPAQPEETASTTPAAEEFTPLATGYTLQFGSFQDRANAIKLSSRLKRDLPGIRIDSDLLNFKEIHRVRFGYFRSRADAQQKADEISKRVSEPCAIMTLP